MALNVLNPLLDLLLPKFCFGCQKPGSYLCSHCYKSIIFTTTPLCPICERPSPFGFTHPGCETPLSINGMFVLGDYSGVLRKMVHFLKYKNVFSLSETLVNLWLEHYPKELPKFDLLTPIPLHPKRLKERGYNQAEILGRLLAQKKNIYFQNNVLQRIVNTTAQMSLKNHKKRRENMKNAFAYTKLVPIDNKVICLIDDVATTGATLFEAARVLKRNGVKTVWGIVLAR